MDLMNLTEVERRYKPYIRTERCQEIYQILSDKSQAELSLNSDKNSDSILKTKQKLRRNNEKLLRFIKTENDLSGKLRNLEFASIKSKQNTFDLKVNAEVNDQLMLWLFNSNEKGRPNWQTFDPTSTKKRKGELSRQEISSDRNLSQCFCAFIQKKLIYLEIDAAKAITKSERETNFPDVETIVETITGIDPDIQTSASYSREVGNYLKNPLPVHSPYEFDLGSWSRMPEREKNEILNRQIPDIDTDNFDFYRLLIFLENMEKLVNGIEVNALLNRLNTLSCRNHNSIDCKLLVKSFWFTNDPENSNKPHNFSSLDTKLHVPSKTVYRFWLNDCIPELVNVYNRI
jgi:hypothetical protein